MSTLESIVIGIVQGLSEFLPISSTAHMTVAGRLMDLIDSPQAWTAFIAVVQLGTLAAVLVYFRKDLIRIVTEFVHDNVRRRPFREQRPNAKMGWYMIVGTIPIAVVGLLARDVIEGALTKNLILIGGSLILLGVILEVAERIGAFSRDFSEARLRDAFWVGMAQVLALVPGSSRSGTTITAGMFLGLKREAAARFSFLLSVPAIGASGVLELFEALDHLDGGGVRTLIVATLFAAVSGYACIALLLRYLRTRTMRVFVFYRCLVGSALIVAALSGWIES